MADVRQWLEGLGLDEYAEAFESNAIDWDALPELDHDLLKEVGVAAVGHRIAILKAIAQRAAGPVTASAQSVPTGAAERRQLTVMFCDLVGSVELGERMDVEDYRDLLARFRIAVTGAVERFDGFVARHQGDGLLAYFGYPRAREFDAERAVRAGLEVVQAVDGLEHPYDVQPKVRVGIATGASVVGDVLSTGASERSELAALGPTPNLAARLQGEAGPNTVVVSETTHRLVKGFFQLDELPPRELKGLSGRIRFYRVDREVAGQTRFSARTGDRLSPFVGREEEVEMLSRRWSSALEGRGKVIVLVGEAGIGKSRLLQQLRDHVGTTARTIHLQCSPYHENSALYPVVAALERVLASIRGSGESSRLDDLRRHLVETLEMEDSAVACLAELLAIPTERPLEPAGELSAQQRRENTLRMLVDYVRSHAAKGPVLCAIEDLHWADPSTREFLGHLVEAVEAERIVVVATTRPGFEGTWLDLAHVSVVRLSRLGPESGEELSRAISEDSVSLPAEIVEIIISRAGGNPLFIEELTRTVVQSGGAAGWGQNLIPATLQDSLMARLDVLEYGKPVIQCASVIGRECPHDLLARVWEGDPEPLLRGLEELEQSGLMIRRGEDRFSTYVFKHALVQDTAYGNLLRERRAALHGRVATLLEQFYPDTTESQPELLARHFDEANITEQAIRYWHRAGQRALYRSAHAETISHISRALKLIQALPDSIDRDTLELGLQITFGPALMNAKGSASPEVREVYRRARELSDRVGDREQAFTATWGLWLHYQMCGEYEAARQTASEVISIGSELPDSTFLLQGHHAAWTTEDYVGNHAKAMEHADKGLAVYDIERHPRSAALYGDHDAGVCGWVHKAYCNWVLGYPDQAVAAAAKSLSVGERVAHPMSLALAQCYVAIVHQLLREPEAALHHAQALVSNSVQHELDAWRLNGEILLGWATGTLENPERGIDMMRDALAKRAAKGNTYRQVYYLITLAELLSSLGEIPAGLEVIDQVLKMLSNVGERRWAPFAHRVHGDLLLAGQEQGRAEVCFKEAIAEARAHDALSLELRAARCLAELWYRQGRHREASRLLKPVYDRFTEGFETPELKDARRLLGMLT